MGRENMPPEVLSFLANVEDIPYAYGDWRDAYAAAEMEYVRQFDTLPEWGVMLQEYEIINGAYLWVFRPLESDA
jgi:hypothetical protein